MNHNRYLKTHLRLSCLLATSQYLIMTPSSSCSLSFFAKAANESHKVHFGDSAMTTYTYSILFFSIQVQKDETFRNSEDEFNDF